jgi:hypothetical protein
MSRLLLPLALALAFAAALPAQAAALLGDASISYSAERTVTVDGKSYTGMVFHRPGQERHEQEMQGFAEVILLDAAKKQGLLVLPGLKTYIAFGFPALMAELDDPRLRRAAVGQETVNGIRTTKYRIDHTAADGSRASGFAWVSAQGVLMRIDGTVTRSGGGRPIALHMELANLAVGPQKSSLFELPPGLIQLPTGAFQSFFSGRSG